LHKVGSTGGRPLPTASTEPDGFHSRVIYLVTSNIIFRELLFRLIKTNGGEEIIVNPL